MITIQKCQVLTVFNIKLPSLKRVAESFHIDTDLIFG